MAENPGDGKPEVTIEEHPLYFHIRVPPSQRHLLERPFADPYVLFYIGEGFSVTQRIGLCRFSPPWSVK